MTVQPLKAGAVEVITLVGTGLLNSRSPRNSAPASATVTLHCAQVMQKKMRAKPVAQLVRIAGRLSLLPPWR
jgi:FixJ family two-component response regulator